MLRIKKLQFTFQINLLFKFRLFLYLNQFKKKNLLDLQIQIGVNFLYYSNLVRVSLYGLIV